MFRYKQKSADDVCAILQLGLRVVLLLGFEHKLVVHAGSSVTKEHSEKVQIKAAKRWNGGSISSFANAEMRLLTKRTVT